MNICIYGASSAELKKIYYEKTEELGQLMGKRGHGLVFGGGKDGLMGAAARGVDREKGYILGIAPRFFDQPGVLYEHCTEFIFTENMRERKHLAGKPVGCDYRGYLGELVLMRSFLRF